MTKPQKIKSLIYFICLLVSAFIYVVTTSEKHNSEQLNTTKTSTITLESDNQQNVLEKSAKANY